MKKSYKAAWHSASVEDVLKALGTNETTGLSQRDVRKRRRKYGINRIYRENHASVLGYLGYCLSDLMLILLLITALTASVFGEDEMISLIVPTLVFSIIVRTFAYVRARRYIEKSSSSSAVMPSVFVLREGAVYRIDARRVVRGDILRLKTGDIVPCDCRIIRDEALSVYEGVATDARGAVHKTACDVDRDAAPSACVNMLFAGSGVLSGSCVAVAVEIGADTLAVRSRGELALPNTGELKIVRVLEKYSRIWGAVMTLTVFIITLLTLIFGQRALYDVFFMGLALATSAMCEYYCAMGDIAAASGLAALAVGDGRGRSDGTSVRGVRSIESLSDTDAILFSENGVLFTDGIECVFSTFRNGKFTELTSRDEGKHLFRCAAVSTGLYGAVASASSSDAARLGQRSSSTRALADYFVKTGYDTSEIYSETQSAVVFGGEADELPFDVQLTCENDGYVAYMNGDAALVIDSAAYVSDESGESTAMSKEMKAALLRAVSYHEKRGAVVIGVAKKNTPFRSAERLNFAVTDTAFVGIVALYRPLAPNVEETVKLCEKAGIRLVMTGAGRPSVLAALRAGIIKSRENVIYAKEFAAMSPSEKETAAKTKKMLVGFDEDRLDEYISLMMSSGQSVAYVADTSHALMRELRILRKVGASFALSHDTISYQSKSERVVTENTSGISQLLKMNSDNIIPRANENGGGLPCIAETIAFSKRIYKNIANIVSYLVTSQAARMMTVLYSALFGSAAMTASQILFWGLIFDFFAVITISLERPERDELMYRGDVCEKLSNPFAGIGVSVAHGMIWGSLTLMTSNIFCKTETSAATVIFVSLILSLVLVCGEHRCESSIFSSERRINLATCFFIGVSLLLIILVTVSGKAAASFGINSPSPYELIVSVIPAVLMLGVYEGERVLDAKKNTSEDK